MIYAQKTDQGLVRQNHEDAMSILKPQAEKDIEAKGILFVVADGLGGLAKGEVASQTAVTTLCHLFEENQKTTTRSWFSEAFGKVNRKIYETNQKVSPDQEMATTLTAGLFFNQKLLVAHVGDCRIYCLREGAMVCLTQDHTLDRHTLIRAIGIDQNVKTDIHEVALRPGDRFLLCSDGLYGMIPDQQIQEILAQNTPEDACKNFVILANQRGGQDNITAQVVHI